jgi:hypothetical protein
MAQSKGVKTLRGNIKTDKQMKKEERKKERREY